MVCAMAFLSFEIFASPRLLQSGPMIGHVGAKEARIWIRLKQNAVVSASLRQGECAFRPARMEAIGEGFYVLHFQSLAPVTETAVWLEVTRDGTAMETASLAFRTAAPPSPTGKSALPSARVAKFRNFVPAPFTKPLLKKTGHDDFSRRQFLFHCWRRQ